MKDQQPALSIRPYQAVNINARDFGITEAMASKKTHPARQSLAHHPAPPHARDPVQYGLRFQILPDRNALPRTRELVAFCRRHRITAVHLFMNAEEYNRGHMTEAEIRLYLRLFRRLMPALRKAGLTVNLNPWSTTLHGSRGRTLHAGQNFDRMVSPLGRRARAVASFACPRWRRYLASLYGRMAAVGFDTIWLEDDFRYHNHDGLDWGGDFSKPMLRRFGRKIGRRVTRAEVLRNVLRPGRPHPWRKRWMALWRECQEETAAEIRAAVAAANPRARLGLMSSNPDTHSAEGRRWEGLFRSIAINARAVHRPNFASYGETVGMTSLIPGYLALDIQKRLRPAWVESHPEIENMPFGRFNKSDTLTFAQMALAKIMGSEGLLLDLHPMTGNGVTEEQGMGEMLDKAYPALAWLGRQFPRELESHGVGVPFKMDAAENARLAAGDTYEKLVSSSYVPGVVLGRLGIACQMGINATVNVIWGPKAWSLNDEEINSMLSGGLWLDGEAAEILASRGFGKYLGIRIKGWLERDHSLYALERFVDPAAGARVGFKASCNLGKRVLAFERAAGAERWTDVVDCMDQTLGPGLSIFRNAMGGQTAVSAFDLYREYDTGGWNLNFQRQALAQNLVRRLAGRYPPVMTSGAPYILTMDLRAGSLRKVVAFNLWADPARVVVAIPGAKRVRDCTVIRPLSKPASVRCPTTKNRNVLTAALNVDLPCYGIAVLAVE